MLKSKYIALIITIITIVTSLTFTTASAVTMYAEDGRTIEVYASEVTAYQNVGWFKAPVQRLYAEGDKTALFFKADVPAQLTVGWFKAPVQRLYAEDGRSELFFKADVPAQLTVGWFKAPVQRLYSKDGRSELFFKTDVPAQLTVGWYTTPQADSNYKKAYADILKNVLATNPSGIYGYADNGFSLVYINNDNIPELVYHTDTCHAAGAYIYTFYNGKAVKLTQYSPYTNSWWDTFGEFGGILYRERENLFTSQYWGMGVESIEIFNITNGTATSVCNLSGSYDYNSYSIDEQEVSFSTYMQQRRAYGFTGEFYSSTGYKNSYDTNHYELTTANINAVLGY